MTTLTQQVEAALTDEVMDAAALEGWTESTAEMRRRILSPLAPVLAQQEATVAEAMKVLAPNMPSSGLVDACRQVKQASMSNADSCELLEAKVATLTAERDRARDMVELHHVECDDPDCAKEIASWRK